MDAFMQAWVKVMKLDPFRIARRALILDPVNNAHRVILTKQLQLTLDPFNSVLPHRCRFFRKCAPGLRARLTSSPCQSVSAVPDGWVVGDNRAMQ